MSKKLIFIGSLPTSKLFGEKLDAWWFSNHGFEVEFWDLSKLFFTNDRLSAYFGGKHDYRYIGPGHRIFENVDEAKGALSEIADGTIVWHISRFYKLAPDDWIFAELRRRNISYCLQHFDTLIEPTSIGQKPRYWLRTQRQRYLNKQLAPEFVVGSGRLGRKQSQSVVPQARFVSIPSIKVLWRPSEPIADGAYNLFVDENVDYAPDANMLGYTISSDPDAYYARMNKLFDDIEEWSGSPVIIAASGKYHYKQDRFNGRPLIYGQTLRLIQHARGVIGHMSLALEQCLVSEKPLLVVDDPSFTVEKRRGYPLSLIHLLIKPINVEEVSKQTYLQAMSLKMENMRNLVLDYLKEDSVTSDYYSIISSELGVDAKFERRQTSEKAGK